MSFSDREQLDENFALSEIAIYNLRKAGMVLRAINHKLRQHIVKTIHENVRVTVTQLFVILRIEQSVASQQLAILRAAGIVLASREGKFIYYSLNFARIGEIGVLATELLK